MNDFKENGTENTRHLWSILCNSSILDAETQALSLNQIADGITIDIERKQKPKEILDNKKIFSVPVQLQIVTKLMKKVPDTEIILEIQYEYLSPTGKVINKSKTEDIKFAKEYKFLQWRARLNSLPVDKSGDYTIRISIKEAGDSNFTEVDRIPVGISLSEKIRFTS